MSFFRRLALHRFVQSHPPSRHVSPAPRDLVSAYSGILPASLLQLWRTKGLGLYGSLQLALIDPGQWQATLDRWIISPPGSVRRIPIALLPFGTLLYYRKLTAIDEDVAYIDPVSKQTGDLAWSLDDCFNKILCEPASLHSIVSPVLIRSARETCQTLEPGEVYEVEQVSLSMQMLRIEKVNALELHRRLRDAVELHSSAAKRPATVLDALPDEYRSRFEEMVSERDLVGLYLSSYLDWHRLLALQSNGLYDLLLWEIQDKTFARVNVRTYSGVYTTQRSSDGDDGVTLDIALEHNSSGGDADDDQLIAMYSNGTTFLLRANELEDMATAIGGRNLMGRSESYFRKVTLSDAFVEEQADGRVAPPFDDFPKALQALIHVEPLRATITHVDIPNPDEEEEGEGAVMCTLDLGSEDGLRMNMPLYSPEHSGRNLEGWVWRMTPHACGAGVSYRRGVDGTIENGPKVGDVLVTRAPGWQT
ncbi:hypothetical protein GQ57_37935 [Burkholderia sp. MSh2]|uniref:GAD-related domain-containing protein n=1 Tax=Burkholderia paludis TaxID=1506587 RepID=A0A6P2SVC7_9BURK|nr:MULTISPECIES: GAD-like domain-containing protein [Burkholderia]KEZ00952.1 hypothetical protein GQ57_37935 [Burkholderia sp. MSh2]CAB3773978.1 hypothetical protein LMG30113_07385 [Burkholderia paludis]VWC47667.1 hypothetical protein BPA30113_07451 [Burkholderia paludis]